MLEEGVYLLGWGEEQVSWTETERMVGKVLVSVAAEILREGLAEGRRERAIRQVKIALQLLEPVE